MKIKKIFIAMSLLLILVFSFGCQPKFNENKAKTDSKQSLQTFLNSHKNKEVLVNSVDGEKIESYVDKNFKEYFTNQFMSNTKNAITDKSVINFDNKNTFYLIPDVQESKAEFFNDYELNNSNIEVDKDNKVVKYSIKGNYVGTKNLITITMKQENDKWKIDKVE